jgi:1-acyl-sn-glycerol-3-phosphate acyltransferase
MRTLACALTMVVLTPVYGTMVIVASLCGVTYKPNGIYERLARSWAGSVVRAAGMRMIVHGAEHARGGPIVFVVNHTSWFDIMALAALLRQYTFIAKRELARIPVFGRAAKAVGIIFIDRANRRSAFDSYRVAAGQVKDGKNVVVYPEGTRGTSYSLRPFKKGPFVLAIAAGVPIVPTIVYGQMEIMRKGSARIRAGVVHVHFLEPVSTAEYQYEQRDDLLRAVWGRMADALGALYGVKTVGNALPADPQLSEPMPTSIQ